MPSLGPAIIAEFLTVWREWIGTPGVMIGLPIVIGDQDWKEGPRGFRRRSKSRGAREGQATWGESL